MLRSYSVAVGLVLLAGAALAEMPKLRPLPRPTTIIPQLTDPLESRPAIFRHLIRPMPRPAGHAQASRTSEKSVPGKRAGTKQPSASTKGSVCGDPAIRGEAIARIKGTLKGCGIDNPVRVTSVDGVQLSQAATIDCTTAKALKVWVAKGLKPAFGKQEVTGLRVAAHYVCRSRNNVRGARISEHGLGRAIDISGFILASGVELTVLKDYSSKRGGSIRKAHKAACGIFGTTLGPGSDGYHRDHIHLDTARYRAGAYCK